MKEQVSIEVLKQRIQARIHKLGEAKPFISGSFIRNSRKCGHVKCRCMNGGEKHPCCMLSSKVKGKTKGIYIPVDLAEEVETWVNEHKRVKNLLKEIDELGEQIIKLHVKTNRAEKENRRNLEE